MTNLESINRILSDVYEERKKQIDKWGEVYHKPIEYLPILIEEVGEIAKEITEGYFKVYGNKSINKNYRNELIQVAAVCVQMIQAYELEE